MKIIGITGGVGSGKSSVLKYLKEVYQATVIEADEVGRMVQKAGNDAYEAIVSYFGLESVGKDGELDRAYLAQLIYADEAKRHVLNEIVHPIVKSYILEQIELERTYGTSYLIIEAAILFESKLDEICDEVWYIYADKELRIKRLMKSRSYSKEKCEAIMASQLKEEEFKCRCSVCIDNSFDHEYTYKQIDDEFIRLKDEQKNEIM